MKDKFPEIYKKKIEKLKSKVQESYYYHYDDKEYKKEKNLDINDLKIKINNIFNRSNFVYQTDVNIMYKNGDNINKKIIGLKDNYLLTKDGERIDINDISDIN